MEFQDTQATPPSRLRKFRVDTKDGRSFLVDWTGDADPSATELEDIARSMIKNNPAPLPQDNTPPKYPQPNQLQADALLRTQLGKYGPIRGGSEGDVPPVPNPNFFTRGEEFVGGIGQMAMNLGRLHTPALSLQTDAASELLHGAVAPFGELVRNPNADPNKPNVTAPGEDWYTRASRAGLELNNPITAPSRYASAAFGFMGGSPENVRQDWAAGDYDALLGDFAFPIGAAFAPKAIKAGTAEFRAGRVPRPEVLPATHPVPDRATRFLGAGDSRPPWSVSDPTTFSDSGFTIDAEGNIIPPGGPARTTIPVGERPLGSPIGIDRNQATMPTQVRGRLPGIGETFNPLRPNGNPLYDSGATGNPVSEGFGEVARSPQFPGTDPLADLLGPSETWGVGEKPVIDPFHRTEIPDVGKGISVIDRLKLDAQARGEVPRRLQPPVPEVLPEPSQPTFKVKPTELDFDAPIDPEGLMNAAIDPTSLREKILRQPDSPAKTEALKRLDKEVADRNAAKLAEEATNAAETKAVLADISPVERARIAGRLPHLPEDVAIMRAITDVEKVRIIERGKKRLEAEAKKAAKKADGDVIDDTMEARIEAALAAEEALEKGPGKGTDVGSFNLQPLFDAFSDYRKGRKPPVDEAPRKPGGRFGAVAPFGKTIPVKPTQPKTYTDKFNDIHEAVLEMEEEVLPNGRMRDPVYANEAKDRIQATIDTMGREEASWIGGILDKHAKNTPNAIRSMIYRLAEYAKEHVRKLDAPPSTARPNVDLSKYGEVRQFEPKESTTERPATSPFKGEPVDFPYKKGASPDQLLDDLIAKGPWDKDRSRITDALQESVSELKDYGEMSKFMKRLAKMYNEPRDFYTSVVDDLRKELADKINAMNDRQTKQYKGIRNDPDTMKGFGKWEKTVESILDETFPESKPEGEVIPFSKEPYKPVPGEQGELMSFKMPHDSRTFAGTPAGKFLIETRMTGNKALDAKITRMQEITKAPELTEAMLDELRTLGYEVARHPDIPVGWREKWSSTSSAYPDMESRTKWRNSDLADERIAQYDKSMKEPPKPTDEGGTTIDSGTKGQVADFKSAKAELEAETRAGFSKLIQELTDPKAAKEWLDELATEMERAKKALDKNPDAASHYDNIRKTHAELLDKYNELKAEKGEGGTYVGSLLGSLQEFYERLAKHKNPKAKLLLEELKRSAYHVVDEDGIPAKGYRTKAEAEAKAAALSKLGRGDYTVVNNPEMAEAATPAPKEVPKEEPKKVVAPEDRFDTSSFFATVKGASKKARKVIDNIAEGFEHKDRPVKGREEVTRKAPLDTSQPIGILMQRIRENTSLNAIRKFSLKEWHAEQAEAMRGIIATGEQGTIQRAEAMKSSPGDLVMPPLKLPKGVLDSLIDRVGEAQRDANGRMDMFVKQRAEQALRKMNKGEYLPPAELDLVIKAFPEAYKTEIINLYSNFPAEHFQRMISSATPSGRAVKALAKGLQRWTLGSAKTARAALDASFTTIQPRAAMFTKGYKQAWAPAIRSFKSLKGFRENQARLRADPMFNILENDMGIHIADLEGPNKPDLYRGGNPALDKLETLQRFHRSAISFLNEIRVVNGKTQIRLAKRRGIMKDTAAMKGIGEAINESTGYGTITKKFHISSAEKAAGHLIWSPRLTAARINVLRLLNPEAYFGSKGYGQRIRLRNAATVAASSLAAMQILEGMGGKAHVNPFDPNFGKVEFDGEFVDTTSGFGGLIATVVRSTQLAITGEVRNSKGEILKGRTTNAPELLSQYGENKMAPAPAFVLKVMRQKNPYTGKPYNLPAEFLENGLPLAVEGITEQLLEIAKGDKNIASILKAIPMFGGVNMYDSDTKKESLMEQAVGLTGYKAKPKKTLFESILPFQKEIKEFSKFR